MRRDMYRRRGAAIQPYGILVSIIGILICTCGLVKEWAKTFPLGDISQARFGLQVGGVMTLLTGIGLLSASHLIYHYSETGTFSNPTINFKVITANEARRKIPKLNRTETRIYYLNVAFRVAATLLATSCLGFCTGYIAEWGDTFPGGLSKSSQRVIGRLGLSGVILSVIILVLTDTLSAYLGEKNKLEKFTIPFFPTSQIAPTKNNSANNEEQEQGDNDTNDATQGNLNTQQQLTQSSPNKKVNYFELPSSN